MLFLFFPFILGNQREHGDPLMEFQLEFSEDMNIEEVAWTRGGGGKTTSDFAPMSLESLPSCVCVFVDRSLPG